MRKTALAALLAAAALPAAGCSGNAGTNAGPSISSADVTSSADSIHSAAPTPLAAYANDYLQAVGPVNAAIAKMAAALNNVPETATGADVAKITDPAADAIDAANERLLRITWPTTATPDVKALVTATATVANDLRAVDGQDGSSIANWETQLAADSGKMAGAVSIVRADLGLPPASSSSCGSAHCA